jgi:hypothetical protein
MYNEGNPTLGATYYERCAQALARGHELYMLTSCQPLSFDFTLLDPYVMLSHSAFNPIKKAAVSSYADIYRSASFRQAFRENLLQPQAGILFLGN